MNKLNFIFDHLSYSNIISSIDVYTLPLQVKKIEGNYSGCNEPKVVYAENIDYSNYNYDQGFSSNLTLNTLSAAVIDADTNAKNAQRNTINNLDTNAENGNTVRLINTTVFGKYSPEFYSATTNNLPSLNIRADVIGISNNSEISTSRKSDRSDTIIGLARISSVGVLEAEATAKDSVLASANSESNVQIEVLAIGIDNFGRIATGKNDDFIAGIADTSTQGEARATSIANAFNLDADLVAELPNSITAEANANAFTNNFVSTFGIFNSGEIFSHRGNDVIFGLANSQSSSNSTSFAEANANGGDLAFATANAEAIAVTQNASVGIINTGIISTGRDNDVVIGLAFNQSSAEAQADAAATANGSVTDTNAVTNVNSVADAENVVAIGIDNSAGLIETGAGSDRVIAYGSTVGIFGGEIRTGRDDDQIIGYGRERGVEATVIYAGNGNDYFKAAIGELDILTGFNLAEKQTGSISNAQIFGQDGDDTFEIGDFDGSVLIDGGINYDTLRLLGDVDRYKFSLGGSNDTVLTIEDEDAGSILTAKSIEAFYLRDGEQLYSVSDLV
jgi:hypothetical protein